MKPVKTMQDCRALITAVFKEADAEHEARLWYTPYSTRGKSIDARTLRNRQIELITVLVAELMHVHP